MHVDDWHGINDVPSTMIVIHEDASPTPFEYYPASWEAPGEEGSIATEM